MAQIQAHAGPGAGPALQPWPLLVWTEAAGVVTEDRQIPVSAIADLDALGEDIQAIATACGTSILHVHQALSYLRSLGV